MDALAQLTTSLADRYRIERELGAGGMALVYLAHDLRHDRKVALKLLRPELSAILGGERFLKEIRTTANLQHPHILPLHDSGEADGLVFYVMPFVEGESLRDRLRREHQLPVDDAVRIAREVASALDYAHRHGVVHRDIKPENILLHDGQALVADFGIALAASRSDGGTRMTETGMSLGTPHYMAPEQAMGEREITPKADLYSLGCVLYEMLVGEPPFSGPTPQAIIARLVTDEPRSLTIQRKTIPPHVEAAVLKALDKLPADRFGTAAQFAEALATGSGVVERVATQPKMVTPARAARWQTLGIPAASLVVATIAIGWAALQSPPSPAVSRYGLALPANQTPAPDSRLILAPDGSRLAYLAPAADGGQSRQVWIKSRDRYDAVPVAGTTGVFNTTFSPDAQWLAFVQTGQLKKLPVIGGAAVTLVDSVATGRSGIAWLDDETIVYIQIGGRQLRRVAATGGASSVVFTDTAGLEWPAPLPNARGVLFIRCQPGDCLREQDLWVLDLESRDARLLVPGVAKAQWVRSGHLVFVRRDGALLAVDFDLSSLRLKGSPVPVLDSVNLTGQRTPLFDVSQSGTLIARAGGVLPDQLEHQMVWVDRSGREAPIDSTWITSLAGADISNGAWSLSPEGRRLAIALNSPTGEDIWIKQLPAGPLSRVTFDSLREWRPRWSADGRSILYISDPPYSAFRVSADGTGREERMLSHPAGVYEADWADANTLVVRLRGGTARGLGRDIYTVRPGVDTAPVPLINTRFDESGFALSPDRKWIAYESDETGTREIYLRPFPRTESGKWQVSTNGGVSPLWASSGRELFYVSAAQEMTAVSVAPGPTFGPRKVLFRMRDDWYRGEFDYYTPWDITRDGQRFVMARRARLERGREAPLIVVENWLEELKQKTRSR